MLRTTLAGLRLHKSRLVTTALAIMLGVMFVAGTLVFTDALRSAINDQVMGSATRFEAVAQPKDEPPEPGAERPVLPAETLREIRELPEVAKAGGIIQGDAPLLDKEGRAVGAAPTFGMAVGEVSRVSADEGDLPDRDSEVALATTSADATGYGVGDEVTVLDAKGEKHTFTVSGLVDFGLDQELSFRGAVLFTPDTATEMTGVTGYSEIDVVGTEGTPAREVTDAVAGVAGADAEVLTGQEKGEELAASSSVPVTALTTGLLLFALVSVAVAAIVIYNTFAILVAQRQQEMALLRCVGARRGQVFRSVVLEALVVGLVASALGVLAGAGLGYAAFTFGGPAFGADASSASLVVSPVAVLAGLGVGTVMTLVAAVLPAHRATRVPPLAALRTSAVATGLEKGVGWIRAAVASVFFLASAALVVLALRADPGEVGMALVAVAGIVAFVGVVAVSPLLVRGVVAVVGLPMRRMGVPSMLAADNARRSPKRAATAMIALTVGATLITGYSVVSASLETTSTQRIREQFPADYQMLPQFGGEKEATVPAEVTEDLRDDPAVAAAVGRRAGEGRLEGHGDRARVVAFFGATLGKDITSRVVAGDLGDLGPGRVALAENYAGDRTVGDAVRLETDAGERSYEIAAVVSGGQVVSGVTMDPADFEEAFPEVGDPSAVYVLGAESASGSELHDAVNDSVAGHPTVQVQSMAQAKQQFDEMLNMAFIVIAALLGLAILIAVFGIANTMALSVLERTRESALLRAMGLAKGQLRRMLSIEAVLLCLIGAGVGIGLGVLFGWAIGRATLDDMLFALPTGQIALFIGVAVVAGLLASVLPARSAARTSITGALASE